MMHRTTMLASETHRERRAAENGRRYRHALETAESVARESARRWPFVWECADWECGEIVSATLPEYEAVRQLPGRFLLRPGHERPPADAVVEQHRAFVVVDHV